MVRAQPIIFGVFMFGAHSAVAAHPSSRPVVTVNIESQRIDRAITAWAEQTGYQVLLASDAASSSCVTPIVRGVYAPVDALKILLACPDLKYQIVNARTVAIRTADRRNGSVEHSLSGEVSAFRLTAAGAAVDRPDTGPSAQREGKDRVGIEQVVVTATKRKEERLQDVPISVAVIGNQDIERRGLAGMQDYLRSIPGVNQIDQGAKENTIIIRGLSAAPTAENLTGGPTVATYFDETPITGVAGLTAGGIDLRPVDVERIEVLRGPQGTTFGSGSLGGALRTIPRKPKLDVFDVLLAASYSDTSGSGSDNSMVQGVVNIPVVTDHLALRGVVYRYDDSGFYRNIAGTDLATISQANVWGVGNDVSGFIRGDIGQMRTTGARLAGLWRVTDNFDLSMTLLTQKIEQNGLPAAFVGKYDQLHYPIVPQSRVRGEEDEVADTNMDLGNVVLNYNVGWATLTSVVSLVDGGSDQAFDYSSPLLIGVPGSSVLRSDRRYFSVETRLASQFKGRVQFLSGIFYEDVHDEQSQINWALDPPAPNRFVTNPVAVTNRERELDQRALFGEVSYQVSANVVATVGGRYFNYERNEALLREGGAYATPYGSGVRAIAETDEGRSSFKANISYKPTHDSLLYGSWAQGFRLGQPAAGVSTTACDRDADGLIDGSNISIESTRRINSDFLDSYEIGSKFALFDRRLVVDAALYHIKWDGLPIRSVPPCNFAYVANAGAATSDGVELQASIFMTKGLRLDLGGGYTNAELSRDALGLLPPAFEGDRLPASPKVSANLAAQYDFAVGGYNAFIRADSFYTGKFYGDFRQTVGTMAGDYVKVDARAGLRMRSISVELFVRNLTNRDAFTWRGLSNSSSTFGFRMQPRTVGIKLAYQFN